MSDPTTPDDRRRCSTCRRWSPAAGRNPDRGTCSDPTTIARVLETPKHSGVVGLGGVKRKGRMTILTVAANAVCPRWTQLPVRFRT